MCGQINSGVTMTTMMMMMSALGFRREIEIEMMRIS